MAQTSAPGLALRFDVQIDGVRVGSFAGCSGLSAQYEAFTWEEGGDNGTVVNLPGRLSYGTVTLTRAVDAESGGPIGYPRAFVRWVTRLLSAMVFFLGYLWMLVDPERQCWHDKLAGDLVIAADGRHEPRSRRRPA